jgi:hypothetical protein
LRKAGKPVPEQLQRKIEQDHLDVDKNDVYNKKVTFEPNVKPPPPRPPQQQIQRPQLFSQTKSRIGLGGFY